MSITEKDKEGRDAEWDALCGDTGEDGELTGNAKFAQTIRDTPLNGHAISAMIMENVHYSQDQYFRALWRPVELRYDDYLEVYAVGGGRDV